MTVDKPTVSLEAIADSFNYAVLDAIVRADAAHIAHLVLEGATDEADAYAQLPEVASRIRRWKETRA